MKRTIIACLVISWNITCTLQFGIPKIFLADKNGQVQISQSYKPHENQVEIILKNGKSVDILSGRNFQIDFDAKQICFLMENLELDMLPLKSCFSLIFVDSVLRVGLPVRPIDHILCDPSYRIQQVMCRREGNNTEQRNKRDLDRVLDSVRSFTQFVSSEQFLTDSKSTLNSQNDVATGFEEIFRPYLSGLMNRIGSFRTVGSAVHKALSTVRKSIGRIVSDIDGTIRSVSE